MGWLSIATQEISPTPVWAGTLYTYATPLPPDQPGAAVFEGLARQSAPKLTRVAVSRIGSSLAPGWRPLSVHCPRGHLVGQMASISQQCLAVPGTVGSVNDA